MKKVDREKLNIWFNIATAIFAIISYILFIINPTIIAATVTIVMMIVVVLNGIDIIYKVLEKIEIAIDEMKRREF